MSIFGIISPDHGCTCEHHAVCGSIVHLDMLVRFKKTLVLSGNHIFCVHFFSPNFSLTIVVLDFLNKYRSILAAYWVTEGAMRCIVGHVPEEFKNLFGHLEGRIAQVTTIYAGSKDKNKIAYSNSKDGICIVSLVDNPVAGDELLNPLVVMVDSDEEAE